LVPSPISPGESCGDAVIVGFQEAKSPPATTTSNTSPTGRLISWVRSRTATLSITSSPSWSSRPSSWARPLLPARSTVADNTVAQVRGVRAPVHVEELERDVLVDAAILEHPRPGPEQNRHQMNRDLVDEAGTERLTSDIGAHHADVLVASGLSRALERGSEVADERVHASIGYV